MPPPLGAEQRTAQRSLALLLAQHVGQVFTLVDERRLEATVPAWKTTMAALIHAYGRSSATLAGRFYLAERAAAGVRGRFTVPYADPPPAAQVDASLGFAVSGLYGAEPDRKTALTVVNGVAQRLVANTGRATVLGSVSRDRAAHGWQRETSGGCDFCQMLASRGAVYSEATADFEAHDHCQCIAVPVFG